VLKQERTRYFLQLNNDPSIPTVYDKCEARIVTATPSEGVALQPESLEFTLNHCSRRSKGDRSTVFLRRWLLGSIWDTYDEGDGAAV